MTNPFNKKTILNKQRKSPQGLSQAAAFDDKHRAKMIAKIQREYKKQISKVNKEISELHNMQAAHRRRIEKSSDKNNFENIFRWPFIICGIITTLSLLAIIVMTFFTTGFSFDSLIFIPYLLMSFAMCYLGFKRLPTSQKNRLATIQKSKEQIELIKDLIAKGHAYREELEDECNKKITSIES